MAASNLYDPRTQHRLDSGEICANGTLYFYQPETETAKNVYSDADLSVSLGSSVELDSAGRTPTDVFLSGAYNIELKDEDGVQVWLAENVNIAASAGLVPLDPADGDENQVYSTDGVNAEWRTIIEVPDPTGHSGKYLGTDGTLVQWTAFDEDVVYDEDNLPGGIVETTAGTNIVIGNTRILKGTGTVPTSASHISSVAVTFPASSFTSAPVVVCTATATGVTNNSPPDDASLSAKDVTTSGFTCRAFCGAENSAGTIAITSQITFGYIAMGPK